MFRIGAFFTSPYHEMPRLGLFIGIERVGSYLFPINYPIGYAYVSEKLFVPESDARALADWINTQMGHKTEQQGIYNKDYIMDIELISYAGEIPLLPLYPKIVGDNDVEEKSK
jgi:hypothetical protein